jgi:hypothetical protein
MAITISSRKSPGIGSANVPGGNLSLINQAGAAGRGQMQTGKEIINLSREVAKLGKIIGTTQASEQSEINLNKAKSMWNHTATEVHSSAINGGAGEIDDNGNYENQWIPEKYNSNMEQSFGALEKNKEFTSYIKSLNNKDYSQFQAWAAGEYGDLSGKVTNLGYQKRTALQKAERTVATNNLFQSALIPDPDKSKKNYIEYLKALKSPSAYGSPLAPDQIQTNERSFVKFSTLNNLFQGQNPNIPETATIEQYDNAITELSDTKYMPEIVLDNENSLVGLTLEERNEAIKELRELKTQRKAIDDRLVEESINATAEGLLEKLGNNNLKAGDLQSAILANPNFIGTPEHTFFKQQHTRLYGTGVAPKEDLSAYFKANTNIMSGNAIPNLAQLYMQDKIAAVGKVRAYLIQNVNNLSDTHYKGVPAILKDFFGTDSELGKSVGYLDKTLEAKLKVKFYSEKLKNPINFSDMSDTNIALMLVNFMNESEQTRAEIQALVDIEMVNWQRVSRARFKADKSGKPLIDLLDAPAIGKDGKVIGGTENPAYIGDRMMNSFLNGTKYLTTVAPVSPPEQLISTTESLNSVASRYTIGTKHDIELQDGSLSFYVPENMTTEDGLNMFWNDVALETYGSQNKLIIFDNIADAPKNWKNGREPLDHLKKRLSK